MKELSISQLLTIATFMIAIIVWNYVWKGETLDERERKTRLVVRLYFSRAVELAVLFAITIHLLFRPLTGLEALAIVIAAGTLTESFSNWYLRRNTGSSKIVV